MGTNADLQTGVGDSRGAGPVTGLIIKKELAGLEVTENIKLSKAEQIEALIQQLPEDHTPYTDKYFLRTCEILEKEGLNPWARAQIFIRKGPGEVFGVNEVLATIIKYSKLIEHGGKVFAKNEGDVFESKEPLLFIEGPIQDIIELETMMLGELSRATSKFNDGMQAVDLEQVKDRMSAVVQAAEGRPVMYAGARHWGYEQDRAISLAALEAGASGASTDIGAETVGKKGAGTIPHALEVIFAWRDGKENAVKEATLAFDKHIDSAVNRIALVDFNNQEIQDAIATAKAFAERGSKLLAVRVDTCGENVAEGGLEGVNCEAADAWRAKGLPLIAADHPDAKYWYGRGVTVTGVCALRLALNEAGFEDVQLIISSGFGKAPKVKAFVEAEKLLGVKLFDGLLAGEVWDGGRIATMDIVSVGEDKDSMLDISKVGRPHRPNQSLKEVDFTEIL